MKEINVKASKSYRILIGYKIRNEIGQLIEPFKFNKVAIITDVNVAQHYLNDVTAALSPHVPTVSYVIPAGEHSKSMAEFERIQQFLLAEQLDRNSAVLALGGGVVGDLAGFVSSTYMRGIGFIQMPSSLLAHDSSVGGKVAINLSNVKNVIGQFYQPDLVIYDQEMLTTLSDQEFRSGLAEVIKHGLIDNVSLLKELMNKSKVSSHDSDFAHILEASIHVKRAIVEHDERESSIRQYLNFGHTLGHAIESVYSTSFVTHGESVMIGILFDLYVSDLENESDSQLLNQRLVDWLTTLGYKLNVTNWKAEELLTVMLADKKNDTQQIALILLRAYGQPYVKHFDYKQIETLLNGFVEYITQHPNVKKLC
ncbi:3-dehydroquinate synthase [Alkalibacillus filiformis]|uniref:3-dehydroquinate synthase n=1 Tax=Alkalibacillus filiformis TaxID=200990 RepID=A0ABU0DQX8_9BACI|nr:3-dehydroquinate synthase [Alkalibacillus filiformis]MDQ0350854.1 3-dehydroquinate synthase [Alkalibacillus filiformis]